MLISLVDCLRRNAHLFGGMLKEECSSVWWNAQGGMLNCLAEFLRRNAHLFGGMLKEECSSVWWNA